jgi:hypothetical protein
MLLLIVFLILVGFFIVLAGMSNGCMDTLDNHWIISRFSVVKNIKLKNYLKGGAELKYIDGDSSRGRKTLFWKINVPVYVQDGWHSFKTIMIMFFMLAIINACIVGIILTFYVITGSIVIESVLLMLLCTILVIFLYFWFWLVGFMSTYRYLALIKKDFGFFLDGILGITKVFQKKI